MQNSYLHLFSQRAMLLATLGLPLAVAPAARAAVLLPSVHRYAVATVPVSGRVTQPTARACPA